MRFKFFFIFFSLIFGILTLSLKKKIQKNKYSSDIRSIIMKKQLCLRKPKKFGEECDINEHCTSNKCEKGHCANAIGHTGFGATCVCDYHCTNGTCVLDRYNFNFRCKINDHYLMRKEDIN